MRVPLLPATLPLGNLKGRRVLYGCSSVVLVLAIAYALVSAGLFVAQRSLIFINDKTQVEPGDAGLPEAEVLALTARDGTAISGWLVRSSSPLLVVYFHGNGASLAGRVSRIQSLRALGASVLALEYRGFGASAGSPSEAGLKLDGDAAYETALRLGYLPEQIVIYGESLGTGVAIAVAAGREVGGVILDAPFSSIEDIVADRYWLFPVRLLLEDPFRSDALIGHVKAPVLILHGADDAVVPIKYGKKLRAAGGVNVEMFTLAAGGHTIFHHQLAQRYVQEWLSEKVAWSSPELR